MSEADRLIEKRFNEERGDIIREGLFLMALELGIILAVWWRFCPVSGFCRETELCRASSLLLPEFLPPFYIILCGLAIPIAIWKFVSFVLSFSLDQAVGPTGRLLRPKWLSASFTVTSLATIILLFSAFYRYTGISGDSLPITHDVGYCIYFSIITITTVGYGDFHPATHSAFSHGVAAAEALAGYMILGVLVSSFSNMFRRVER